MKKIAITIVSIFMLTGCAQKFKEGLVLIDKNNKIVDGFLPDDAVPLYVVCIPEDDKLPDIYYAKKQNSDYISIENTLKLLKIDKVVKRKDK
jgi:hypothetical protein